MNPKWTCQVRLESFFLKKECAKLGVDVHMFGVLDAHVPDVNRATHTHAVRATRRTSITKRSTNWSMSDILITLTEAQAATIARMHVRWGGWDGDGIRVDL